MKKYKCRKFHLYQLFHSLDSEDREEDDEDQKVLPSSLSDQPTSEIKLAEITKKLEFKTKPSKIEPTPKPTLQIYTLPRS